MRADPGGARRAAAGGRGWGGDEGRPGQAAARGCRDVRRGGAAVRPDQHGAVVRAGPALAAADPAGAGAAAGGAGAGPGRRHRGVHRRTRPGRGLVVCEFSRPTWPPFRTVYVEYLMRALPALARRVASNPTAYEYLAESIRAWPDQKALAGQVSATGWRDVAWRNLSGGIVALHR